MTQNPVSWLRRQAAGIVALVVMVSAFYAVKPDESSAAEKRELAKSFQFEPMSIAMPAGFKQQTVRKVNKAYKHIEAWISSVGAGVAMNDIDNDGLPNDLCITDPRIDQAVITPAPVPGRKSATYEPFALDMAPLPKSKYSAPIGCVPGDFNEDGATDLLVYYWGRTPVIFQQKKMAWDKKMPPKMECFEPIELVPGAGGGIYTGPLWNSNAAAVADFDGDGHKDLYIGNYFPESPVLDDTKDGGVTMNDSMSHAQNGGGGHFFLKTPGGYKWIPADKVVPEGREKGWTLAASATDVDGDLLPELYLGLDFGSTTLLHNRSTPGELKFVEVKASHNGIMPKSKEIGRSSFKGMGIDWADLNGDGILDAFLSNITTSFGIQESNYTFISKAKNLDDLHRKMSDKKAPWKDESASLNTAWSGWGWDAKMADFDNDGRPEITQATGFVKGKRSRWAQLQELATANDLLVRHPGAWPKVEAGDDLAGDQYLRFWTRNGGKYDNISPELGLDVPVPTRGIATGDADGDGRLDFVVARQWDAPVFYCNLSPAKNDFLGLKLVDDKGSPVVGAQVRVNFPDGKVLLGRVDGGSGHSGKRSTDVHIGLGKVSGPVQASISWRDTTGQVRKQALTLSPGWHSVQLGTEAKEK
ncbi:CRTAC1 family protein [Streptomyces sp. NBC_00239]|uniref:UnbV n=1 Tax=Streptomyces macromomyceticus TaxID=1917 RepID=Q84HJ5_STRMA|nr:CRTAC1 family protein [Streptomyces sp. NBC_00239]AAO25892.1 UnbV [Streptomyces macromomyceticus]